MSQRWSAGPQSWAGTRGLNLSDWCGGASRGLDPRTVLSTAGKGPKSQAIGGSRRANPGVPEPNSQQPPLTSNPRPGRHLPGLSCQSGTEIQVLVSEPQAREQSRWCRVGGGGGSF